MRSRRPTPNRFSSRTDQEEKKEIAQYFVEKMEEGVLYIIGPGTTTNAIAQEMGLKKTLLGVDVYRDRNVVSNDAGERNLLSLLETSAKAVIVATPIGMQGFIFGRGNQQISADVIRKVGIEHIRIVATPSKLRTLAGLRVDTGDVRLDEELKNYRRVLVGYGREKLMKVE